ncbi:hypothetical protein GpartN1_g6996.t1 [Galdieria partita]|uniref:Nuclear pore complex protein Nup85 n=1 Tax=Galdieria partita TaxID=83374 RepID=A0A9C7UT02_9RHOD|nr:hypothetical protein GpartN1_g6500.t1 [Galdieria partita]GJQ15205.1 hypothetical protein GpartN1_g6996.t1 [Galdieria partita]
MAFVFGENKEMITISSLKGQQVTTSRSYMEGQHSQHSSWLLILQGHLYFTQTHCSVEQRCKNYTTAVYEALQWAQVEGDEVDRESLFNAWQVWKLLETMLCVSETDKGLLKRLQSWLWITQEDLLQSVENCKLAIEENDVETLWKTVYRLAAIGDYTRAIDLIYQWQGYDEHQVAHLFLDDSPMDLMEISPLLIAAAALFEAPDWDDAGEEDWIQWQAKIHHILKMRPIQDELYTLLKILIGKDIQLLANVVSHWHEMLLAVVIYMFSPFEEYVWERVMALVHQYYTLPTQLHALMAIFKGNYTELIADVVHLKSFWHAAHLSDLLCQWKENPNIVVYDKEDIRKYYILEYMGSLPIHHVGLLPIIRDYCRTCGLEGWSWFEQRLIYSLPLDSCDWDTLEDGLLDDYPNHSSPFSTARLHDLVNNMRMNKFRNRYFDSLYGYCRLGRIDMIQRYLDNPMGMQKAIEEKNIDHVVHILQSILCLMKAANASLLLDTEFSYFIQWLQLAQSVQQQDIQHAIEYFATMIACCAMGTQHTNMIAYGWEMMQWAWCNQNIQISWNHWMDIVAGLQNMKTSLACQNISANEDGECWSSMEKQLLQWFTIRQ